MAVEVKTLNNLAYASVKTRNGLAVADIRTINGLDVTGGGAPSVIAHTGKNGTGGNNFTTDAIDTTGSNFIVISVGWYPFVSGFALSDSEGNTWTPLTVKTQGNTSNQLFYCFNPSTDAAHTFTVAGNSLFGSACVIAFDNIEASPFDQENGGVGSGSTLQTGSITPGQANTLVVAGLSHVDNSSGAVSINGGFVITDAIPYVGSNGEGCAIAYLVLSSIAAQNPTWDMTNSADAAATIASFKY